MYIMKEKEGKRIKKDFTELQLAKTIGVSPAYVSLILNCKKTCPKKTAFCMTKAIDSNAEIEKYFERIS